MMTPARRVFPGQPDQVARARTFLKTHCGPCPVLDDAVLLTSELCTNAVRHSASGDDGSFEVVIHRGPNSLRVEVLDDGAASTPAARDFEELAENGRGLEIVALIAARWGQRSDEYGRSVFFELRWRAPATSPDSPPARVSRYAHPVQRPPRERRVMTGDPPPRARRPLSPQSWSVIIDGQLLRELRRRKGLSQEKLFAESGISLTTITRLEGQRWPVCRGRTARRLAAALGTDPVTLLAPDPAEAPTPPPAGPDAARAV
jgi:anti-sigma regulatory factor (Ser/Thr protein kinase)/DNA-binding XRE family transcriptional regulator